MGRRNRLPKENPEGSYADDGDGEQRIEERGDGKGSRLARSASRGRAYVAADLDVSFEDGTLEIRGTKRAEREIRTRNYDRTERYHTPFQRSVRVRAAVDPETVGATLKNGILLVRLPRAKAPTGGAQKERIPIKGG